MNLADNHAALIAASAIAPAVAEARGYRTATKKSELAGLGFSAKQQRVPALLIPIYGVDGTIVTHQARPDDPRIEVSKKTGRAKPVKYETPAGSAMALDVPRAARAALGDPSRALFITEGARKADAAVSRGLCCIAVLGVWNWRGTNEKGGKVALPEWESIALNGRDIFVVFDSDVMLNPNVHDALVRLKAFLEHKHARVRLVYLPAGPASASGEVAKVGLDDFFAAGRTVDDVLALATDTLRELPAVPVFAPDGEAPEGKAEIRETDVGNARRLVALHGEDLRYCPAWGSWLAWDGRRWLKDEKGKIYRFATRTVATIFKEAFKAKDDSTRDRLFEHAKNSESERAIKAMINLASKHEKIAVAPDDFDTDPWSLTVANGVVDLRTGALGAHDRSRLTSKCTPIAYDPDATCPTWDAFLLAIMNKREELVSFLQRAVGYSLTGITREHVLFFCYGTGSNGKSTFLETLETLLGDLARHASMDSFMESKARSVRSDLARLAGARLVTASELENGAAMAEGVVKSLTGADTITAAFLYHDEFEYRPQFKLWLAGNHKPRIRGADEGIWRRIRLIPFEVRYHDDTPENEKLPAELRKDKKLPDRLQAELPGILAWAIRGCVEWAKNGLSEPKCVKEATQEYREEEDTLGAFLAERCFVGPHCNAFARMIYGAYQAWAERSGERPWSARRLGMALRERGFKSHKDSEGCMVYEGIGVKALEEVAASDGSPNVYGGNGGNGASARIVSHPRTYRTSGPTSSESSVSSGTLQPGGSPQRRIDGGTEDIADDKGDAWEGNPPDDAAA